MLILVKNISVQKDEKFHINKDLYCNLRNSVMRNKISYGILIHFGICVNVPTHI